MFQTIASHAIMIAATKKSAPLKFPKGSLKPATMSTVSEDLTLATADAILAIKRPSKLDLLKYLRVATTASSKRLTVMSASRISL
ncbi:MAG: hypothetical protein BGP09_28875 [Rhizobium sp. 60-20]|nr:MAG: hypothetical protein BGP09_28875 [Rhizobium sp. 60-20]